MRRVSKEARDLIRILLEKDPEKRPTPIQALTHPWFTNEESPLRNSINLNKLLAENKHTTHP